ncbi:arginine utilization protein RocB [Aminivibrio pyruvatiphilus]|uniref:Arginine utilization protein RocB n=2 Tax=Aminivibrio pyruvatiphilus TaxID=1005740 RepID=A0A4R8MA30_9BACT|nr:arginine utilization protein RocB [Aminivibrio pyruvatiphilus]
MTFPGKAKKMNRYEDSVLYRLLTDLVKFRSVSPSREGENRIARFIFETLSAQPYFRRHPEDVRLLPLENDPLGRHFVFAVVRAQEPTADTVLLAGHMDVVGVQACGSLAPFAFDPEEYTERIRAADISPEVRKDLETGEWLFGRGVADMKSGLAGGMDLVMRAAGDGGSPGANIALLAVPDEENNSSGMLSAASFLARFQKEEKVRFLACIMLEPTFAAGEEAKPSMYLGSIGKINPFFFCAGKETHVGEYYEGFSAAPVLSHINLMLDGSPEYADSRFGRSYPPFGCMRQTDLRREYSATIMTRGFAFYSYLTATRLPGQILSEMRAIAAEALDRSISRYRKNAEAFSSLDGSGNPPKSWTPQVMDFEDLSRRAEDLLGNNFTPFVEETLASAPEDADERGRAIELVEAMVELCGLAGPLVIVGFLPPWYPHRSSLGDSEGERAAAWAAGETVREAEIRFGETLQLRPFFEGVSDLSYCGFQGPAPEMDVFARNMPGWGKLYSLPTEALAELDIPVLNLGPLGRDAHKNTERIHLRYAMEVFPHLLEFLVKRIIEKSRTGV